MTEPHETCDEQTMTTQHGHRLDWSVPRFCNLAKGHDGEHVYRSGIATPVVIDGTEPRMREHLCIKDLQVHDGPVEDCCIDEWRDQGAQP